MNAEFIQKQSAFQEKIKILNDDTCKAVFAFEKIKKISNLSAEDSKILHLSEMFLFGNRKLKDAQFFLRKKLKTQSKPRSANLSIPGPPAQAQKSV